MAEKFNVTKRTIRNDIKIINNFLKFFSKSKIVFDDNILKITNLRLCNNIIKRINLKNYNFNAEERIIMEIYILLYSNDYITTTKISNLLTVSQSTVFTDIESIMKYLNTFDLKLQSSPGKGLLLYGKEINFRKLFINIIKKYFYLIELLENTDISYCCFCNKNNKDLEKTFKIISEIEVKFNIIFSEISIKEIKAYITFLIFRLKSKYFLNIENINIHFSNITDEISNSIEKNFDIRMNSSEKYFLDKLIEKSEYKSFSYESTNIIDSQFLTKYIIEKVSYYIDIPLYLDYKLYESLSFHIERIKNSHYNSEFISKDEKILNFKINNKRLYDVISMIIENSCQKFITSINNDEIYYIVIYFYMSIQRVLNFIIRDLKITIVCNSGIGTGQLLLQNLVFLFSFKNIESISSRQLSENRLKNSDVLISTVNLSENIKDYIKVSPILTDEDKKNIFEKTLNKAYKRLNKLNVVNKSSLFIQKLQKEEKNGKGIDYFLKEENILIDVVAKNWKESIEIVGNDLVNKKKIKKEYINDMIENIVNYGPYVVIQKGFALPHASISNNVLETSFVLARLKNPVKYNAFELDPIKYVCVLAVTEDKNHLKALFEFINLIRNKNFLKKLNLAKTSKDISELFKNKGEYI